MREGNSERRSYVLGLLTGLIIVAFLFCIVFIVKTIIGPGESGGERGRVASASHERPSSDDPEDEGNQGYCYQMWRCTHGAVRLDGAHCQLVIIIPDKNAVITVTSNISRIRQFMADIWKYIYEEL